MFVEILDGRRAGQLIDMNPGAAIELINQGRAKRAFSDPSPALPPKPGGYSGTYTAAKASPVPVETSPSADALQERLEDAERQIRQSQERQQHEAQAAANRKKKNR